MIKCIGRRRLHVSKNKDGIALKITLNEDRYIATLVLTKKEALKMIAALTKEVVT